MLLATAQSGAPATVPCNEFWALIGRLPANARTANLLEALANAKPAVNDISSDIPNAIIVSRYPPSLSISETAHLAQYSEIHGTIY